MRKLAPLLLFGVLASAGCLDGDAWIHRTGNEYRAQGVPSVAQTPPVTPEQVTLHNAKAMSQALEREMDQDAAGIASDISRRRPSVVDGSPNGGVASKK